MLTCQQDQRHHILYDERVKVREGSEKYDGLNTFFGQVLGVCAVGNTIEEAHKSVHELVEQIYFVRNICYDTLAIGKRIRRNRGANMTLYLGT